MGPWGRHAWIVLQGIFGTWWWKASIYFWSVIASYDLVLSQVVPLYWTDRFPKVRDVIDGGWLPFWGWLLILAAIVVAASFDFACRRAPRHPALTSDLHQRTFAAQKTFELWEAACLIGGQHLQRPPPPGPAFLAMERMRRAFEAGELMLILPNGEREFLRSVRQVQRMSLTKLDPPLRELDDRTKISRDELVSYVRKLGIAVPGLTDD